MDRGFPPADEVVIVLMVEVIVDEPEVIVVSETDFEEDCEKEEVKETVELPP